MSEVQFIIPAQTGYHLLSARDKGQSAARSRVIGWAVAGTEMLVMTEDGMESLGYTSAIMFPNNRVKSSIGEFDNVPAWLSAVRERWEAADAETTAALLAWRGEVE